MNEVMTTPKYEAYKDTNNLWLGEVPSHWDIKKFKYLASVQKGKLPKKLTSLNNGSLPPYLSMDYLRGGLASQFVGDRDAVVVNDGEVLLLWDGSNSGEFIRSRKGVVSSTVASIQFKGIDSSFAWYTSAVVEKLLRSSTIGMGIPHVDGSELKNSMLAVPPKKEQITIANFLDKKTAQIDEAIAIKEKQIELLKERKQIIIQQAVTQGLNPDVPMKNSGVEWTGEIPEHWEYAKLKYYIEILPGYAFKSEQYSTEPDDIRLLRGVNVSPSYTKWNEVVYWPKNKVIGLEKYFLKEGDLVIGMDRPWVSSGIRVTEIKKDDLPCLLLQRVGRIRGNREALTAYIKLLLSTNLFLNYFGPMLTGIGVPHISSDQIEGFCAPMPPVGEQKKILEFLQLEMAKYDESILSTDQQIEKLKEYKTTLINSAVTGKIKVPVLA